MIKTQAHWEEFKIETKLSNPYKFCIIDTVSNMERFISRQISAEYGVSAVGEIKWGAGWGVLRERTVAYINFFASRFEYVIVLGHVAKKSTESDNGIDSVKELELAGKNAAIVIANVDGIGYLYRNDGEVWCKFISSENDKDAISGCRVKRLAGTDFALSITSKDDPTEHVALWHKIYPELNANTESEML